MIKDRSLFNMEFPPKGHNSVAQGLNNYVNIFCIFFSYVSTGYAKNNCVSNSNMSVYM